jgi:chromosome segregation ATPase
MSQVNPNSPKSQASQTAPGPLPLVRLEVARQGAPPQIAEVNDIGFVIGSVPGCDLRLPGAELPPVLCLISRHVGGASLRKLAPTCPMSLNGRSVTASNLAEGDLLNIGSITMVVRVEATAVPEVHNDPRPSGPVLKPISLSGSQAGREPPGHEKPTRLEAQGEKHRAGREQELVAREQTLARHEQEVVGLRQELADVHRQLYERYRQRRDRLAGLQNAIEQAARNLQERKRQVESQAQELAQRRSELGSQEADLSRARSELAEQSQAASSGQEQIVRERAQRESACLLMEQRLAQEREVLDKNQGQYQRDLIRLDRLQATLEQKQEQLHERAREVDQRAEQLQRTSREIEDQAKKLDAWHERLRGDEERMARQKNEQDAAAVQLKNRAAGLEGQQTTLAALRTRLERAREELRAEHQHLAEQQTRLHEAERDLQPRLEEAEKLHAELDADKRIRDEEQRQMEKRREDLESALAQLQQAQEAVSAQEATLAAREQELELRSVTVTQEQLRLQEHAGELTQLQERFLADRQALREREGALVQAEQARANLQDQLRRRADEIARKEEELAARAREQLAEASALVESAAQVERDRHHVPESQGPGTPDLADRTRELERLQDELARREHVLDQHLQKLRSSGRVVGTARKVLRQEQALLAQAQAKLALQDQQAQSELESARAQTVRLREQLPGLEQRARTAIDRLGQARAQLREHLAELHAYANQSQEDIEALRGQLQAEEAQLQEQRLALHKAREEQRLAVAAFRQQVIEWQGQVADMKRSLAEGETQLERRQAEVDEQARQIHASSARLAEKAELLERQEIDVAERHQEVEGHLEDMREWYRQKLRQLSERRQAECGTTPQTGSPIDDDAAESEGIAPRNILQITSDLAPGDRKLGELLRSLALVDAQTLTSLLLEARRQRRTLRQILLAGGYLTLYQMALIEAGNLDGLVLGRLRVVDRLGVTEHESLYRVYDPLRGHELLLRHLSETETENASRLDEFRQGFGRAAEVLHPHLAATFEVMEIAGRPAAAQEWLVGLPSTEWTPLAAVPGVWYRLLCQAALGLHTAHKSNLVHGHLAPGAFTITGEGILKIVGLGEPAWLSASPEKMDQQPDPAGDLLALGRSAEYWWALSARRKGARPKPPGKPLQAIVNRLTAKKASQRFGDTEALLEDLENAGSAMPANTEAWDRFLLYVREHATDQAGLRQSA